jgi:YHS domain-containing protein
LEDPFPAESEAEADRQGAPFTGLQLEMDPYGEPLPSLPAAPPSNHGPVIAPGIPAYDAVGVEPRQALPSVPTFDGGPRLSPTGTTQPPAELPRVIPQQPLPVPQTGLTAPSTSTSSSNVEEKMSRIAARQGLKGFKGFCPVMLRDYRELADAKLEHSAIYQGNQYWFSSAEARQAFITNPGAYVPASGGIDVVLFQQSGRQELGSLDYAVWYRSRLYLFTSELTKAEFVASPRTHALDQAAAP